MKRPAPKRTGDLFGDPYRQKLSDGYAGTPGRGPKGETCKTCIYSAPQGGTSKTYWKCHHAFARVTRGPGSDIRLRTPACEYWEKG